MAITIKDLTEIASDFLRENYGMELAIPIVRNNRLRSTMGSYVSTRKSGPIQIEIAGYVIKYATREVVIDTLKHELVHYALHVKGEPYDDGHPHFESELRRLGVSATRTSIVGLYYVGRCIGCGDETFGTNKRITYPGQQFISRCCKTPVEYEGERIFNGTEAI